MGETVALDGGSSKDPDGDSLQYRLTKIKDLDTVKLTYPNTVNPSFTIPEIKQGDETIISMRLKVTDKDGHTDTDRIDIKIKCLVDVMRNSFIQQKKS